jgi:hypothetical protein
MENEIVWGAVDQLAGWLGDLWAEIDAPEDKEGTFSETMSGQRVRAIIGSLLRRAEYLPSDRAPRLHLGQAQDGHVQAVRGV